MKDIFWNKIDKFLWYRDIEKSLVCTIVSYLSFIDFSFCDKLYKPSVYEIHIDCAGTPEGGYSGIKRIKMTIGNSRKPPEKY